MLYRINKVYNYAPKCFPCGINNSAFTDLSFMRLAAYQPCMDYFSLQQSNNIRRFNMELSTESCLCRQRKENFWWLVYV